uniref:RNase H type-1 domain-containing protein n=2 Tax=Nicotiana TaxID=4085 RepID=A0A1S4A9I1_TOBAC|nr:PREDICTED: uncharacterized protein LOC107795219 [Nicotiana tabacum]
MRRRPKETKSILVFVTLTRQSRLRRVPPSLPSVSEVAVLYTDGASNALGSGLGLVLKVPTGKLIRQSVRYPEITNNEAEYEAVIAGLKLALKHGARWVILCCDSQLIVNQVTGNFQIKEQRLQKYQIEIHKLLP